MSLSDTPDEIIKKQTQGAVETLKFGSNLLQNISLTTQIMLLGSITALLAVNVILINADQTLSKTGLTTAMIIDVGAVVVFLAGFFFLCQELGSFMIFHTQIVQ